LNFRGTFEHSLDAKNRLTVPSKYRAALSNGVVVALSPESTPGAPRTISIWVAEDYDAYASAALAGRNPIDPVARRLKQILNNNALDTELDSAHRVMLPAKWLADAGLGKEVVVTGSGDCLEVWDRAAYNAYNQEGLSHFPDIAASVGNTP
jgi:MraZ protein